jgi:hypothetical protein
MSWNSVNWIAGDIREDSGIEYEHSSKIHYLPGAKAVHQAHLSAEAVEQDRRLTRMAEIEELLQTYQAQRDSLNAVIFTLENEYELQRKAKS